MSNEIPPSFFSSSKKCVSSYKIFSLLQTRDGSFIIRRQPQSLIFESSPPKKSPSEKFTDKGKKKKNPLLLENLRIFTKLQMSSRSSTHFLFLSLPLQSYLSFLSALPLSCLSTMFSPPSLRFVIILFLTLDFFSISLPSLFFGPSLLLSLDLPLSDSAITSLYLFWWVTDHTTFFLPFFTLPSAPFLRHYFSSLPSFSLSLFFLFFTLA